MLKIKNHMVEVHIVFSTTDPDIQNLWKSARLGTCLIVLLHHGISLHYFMTGDVVSADRPEKCALHHNNMEP